MDALVNGNSAGEEGRGAVELLKLAGPSIMQMASYTVMQFIDTWLLTRIGDVAATAASTSGMFAFSAISLGFGVLLLVNTLVSQSYGEGNRPACGRYLWQGIWFAVFFAVLLRPLAPAIGLAFRGHDPALRALEMAHLRIVLSAAVCKFVATAMGDFMLAINRPNAVLFSSVTGVMANVVAAYGLILGHFGLPRLGVVGAAWAQNIGVTCEMLVLIFLVSRREIRQTYGLADWRLRGREFWTLLRAGIPSGVQIVAEVLAWSGFVAWVVGEFGTTAMAANAYMFRFMQVSFMPAIGIGTAVTALVGRYIGRGRPDVARQRAHLGFRITIIYMAICGIFFFTGRHWLMSLFTRDPAVLRIGAVLLTFAAVYQIFDAMYIIYAGGLRGAGDTFVPAVATGTMCWTIMICGGYVLARHSPGLGVVGPWLAATTYGVLLGLFMLTRFSRGRWESIHLARQSASQSGEASAKVADSLPPQADP